MWKLIWIGVATVYVILARTFPVLGSEFFQEIIGFGGAINAPLMAIFFIVALLVPDKFIPRVAQISFLGAVLFWFIPNLAPFLATGLALVDLNFVTNSLPRTTDLAVLWENYVAAGWVMIILSSLLGVGLASLVKYYHDTNAPERGYLWFWGILFVGISSALWGWGGMFFTLISGIIPLLAQGIGAFLYATIGQEMFGRGFLISIFKTILALFNFTSTRETTQNVKNYWNLDIDLGLAVLLYMMSGLGMTLMMLFLNWLWPLFVEMGPISILQFNFSAMMVGGVFLLIAPLFDSALSLIFDWKHSNTKEKFLGLLSTTVLCLGIGSFFTAQKPLLGLWIWMFTGNVWILGAIIALLTIIALILVAQKDTGGTTK